MSHPPARLLIVNADDLGISVGVNRGILEAHQRGIVTSASLMVTAAAAADAVAVVRGLASLSVGTHLQLTDEGGALRIDPGDPRACAAELERQVALHVALVGAPPTHLDSHHNIHRDPRLEPVFVEVARRWGLPLREHSAARYFSGFYGQWDDGSSHPEWIAPASLARMLDEQVSAGEIVELGCHPGYADGLVSSYRLEREVELRTLTDASLPPLLERLGVRLIGFADLEATGAA